MDLLGYHNNTVEILTNDISLLLLTSMNEGTPIVVSVRLYALRFFALDVLISSICSSITMFQSQQVIIST